MNILLAEEDETEEETLNDYGPLPVVDEPRSVFCTLTRKPEIRLFRKLLKGRPVELTDASPETATIREILEMEAIVSIEPKSGKVRADEAQEFELSGSVFWSKDKNRATIIFD